jgi:hypothetical protein
LLFNTCERLNWSTFTILRTNIDFHVFNMNKNTSEQRAMQKHSQNAIIQIKQKAQKQKHCSSNVRTRNVLSALMHKHNRAVSEYAETYFLAQTETCKN